MKSDVNLNLRLTVGGQAILRRRFQMFLTNRTVPGQWATLASKDYLNV